MNATNMDAIDLLMSEHRIIERGLDALDNFAAELRKGSVTDEKGVLADFVKFLQEFADRHHHGKEEDILFQKMVAAGFPLEAGPIAVMLHEHDEGRALVRKLESAAQQSEAWEEAQRSEVAGTASTFVSLLEAHIEKEDEILYPMARARLDEATLGALNEETARFQKAEEESGKLPELLALAAELAAS